MYWGCQCSSARCRRLLLDRPTLFGIFSAEIIRVDPCSYQLSVSAVISCRMSRQLSAEAKLIADSSKLTADTYVLLKSNSGRAWEPYAVRAPLSPTAFGRWKIQFCQAVSR